MVKLKPRILKITTSPSAYIVSQV